MFECFSFTDDDGYAAGYAAIHHVVSCDWYANWPIVPYV
jgi:hypothetical protein